MAARPSTRVVHFDQCQVDLCAPGSTPEELPIKKRTTLMTNAPCIESEFKDLQCSCVVDHYHIQGSLNGVSLSKHCQVYTPKFCEHLARATLRQKELLTERLL